MPKLINDKYDQNHQGDQSYSVKQKPKLIDACGRCDQIPHLDDEEGREQDEPGCEIFQRGPNLDH